MKHKYLIFLMVLFMVPLFGARKALIIGNAAYEQAALTNPLNDANDMAKALQELGFAVSLHQNLNLSGFYAAVGSFASALVPSDEVVFFYSGHAAQINGTNYLIPVNEYIDSAVRCEFLSYNCDMLLKELNRAGLSIMILDACRDNPYDYSRSLQKGLATMRAAAGTQYIIFATEEGKVAEDGSGRNSPFTESLLANIRKPDQKITDLMQLVSNDVAIKTQERQIPYGTGLLRQNFYFARTTEEAALPKIIPDPAVPLEMPPKYMDSSEVGKLKVLTKYGGELFLDGVFETSLFAESEYELQDMKVGEHVLDLKNPREQLSRKVNIIKNQTSLLDFDAADSYLDELGETPQNQGKTNKTRTASPSLPKPPLPPIKNQIAAGSGSLELLCPMSGEVFLGGNHLGSVSANKSKRFNRVNAGDFTLEIFGQIKCHHQETRISDGGNTRVTVFESELIPYSGEMLYVQGGEYFRGTQFLDRHDSERPRHEVQVPPFLMGDTEVVQKLWTEVMGYNPSVREGDKLPVTNVSWYQAVEFCNALSIRDGFEPAYKINKDFPDANNSSDFDSLRYSVSCNWRASGYRLPTEAEWEFAAKCGDSGNVLQFSGSGKLEEVGWYVKNSLNQVHEVASKEPNTWGFFDLSGNVFEWCWDYQGPYQKDKQVHPRGAVSGSYRIARGGSWMAEADACSNTARGGFSPHSSSKELGFRLVRNARAY
ncbi:hypothetical protein MASR1M36_14910 [Candidatus Cloacimonadaceae bacterium]